MRGWCAALLAVAGCDGVFGLTRIPADRDAATDSQPFLDAPEMCPPTYAPYLATPVESVYRWVGPPATWVDAEGDCENDSRTGVTHLVVFDHDGEMSALRDGLSADVGGFAAHVGYARNVADDWYTFFAVTGEQIPPTHPPWNMAEPSGIREETTVRFESGADLIDQPDTVQLSYVCECDHRKATRTFTLH